MIVIGIDPHKTTHTATAVDAATNADLGSIRIDADLGHYQRLMTWAQSWPTRKWAIENAEGLGHHLALWLLAIGETVLDVRPTATARVRQLSRGGRRKTDRIDAAAAACVAALQGDARRIQPETITDTLGILDERRENLSNSRTRTVNQLHALLRDLLAGGAPTALSPAKAEAAIENFTPLTATDTQRLVLVRDLIDDLRRFDRQLRSNSAQAKKLLDEHGTRLREIDGIGEVVATRILARTGTPSRFPTAAAYATYTGTAPVQIASAHTSHHRLSRFGDRKLNSAIHTVAITQIRMPHTDGRAYYDKKIAEGKTPRAARRSLKRHLATHLWKIMLADHIRSAHDNSSAQLNSA